MCINIYIYIYFSFPIGKKPSELRVSLERLKISSKGNPTSHSQAAVCPPVCPVQNKPSDKSTIFLHGNEKTKWQRLEHSTYSIYMQEDDKFIMVC